MITFRVDVKVTDSTQFAEEYLRAIFPDILDWFNNFNKNIRSPFQSLVFNIISTYPDYLELVGNPSIVGELGLVRSTSKLQRLLTTLTNNLTIQIEKPRISAGKLIGSSQILVIRNDYSEILHLAEASFTSEGGYVVEWLKHLLLDGTRKVIRQYDFRGEIGRGRTGMGFMVKGNGWSVPPQIAGIRSDNFITRAIDAGGDQIIDLMEQTLERS